MALGRERHNFEREALEYSSRSEARELVNPLQTLVAPTRNAQIPRTSPNIERDYGDIDTRTAYRSNGNVDWSRASFKVKKPKQGKIRHLSKEELFGIGMSFLLSIFLAIFIAFALVTLSPIVLKNMSNFIYDVKEVSSLAKGVMFPPQREKAAISVELRKELTESQFLTHCYKQTPCLFTGNSSVFSIESMQLQFLQMLDLQINNIDSNSTTFTSPSLISNFVNGETSDLFSDLFEAVAKLSVEQQCSVVSDHRYFEPMFSGATMLIVSKPTAHFRSTSFLNSRGFHSFLFKGQKRWIIFPPDRLPENGFDTTQLLETILSSNLSKLNDHEQAFVVVQNENESVYVPEGWFYSYEVLNSSLSASINYEASTFDSSSFYQFYKSAMEKLSLGEIPAAIKYFKLGLALNRNILLLEGLADALTANSQFLAAEEFYREALILNPQFVSAYSKLIQLMMNHASKDISESIAELLQQAEKAGVRERVLLLVQDNL